MVSGERSGRRPDANTANPRFEWLSKVFAIIVVLALRMQYLFAMQIRTPHALDLLCQFGLRYRKLAVE